LFALRRHCGIFVGTGFGEILGSEKQRGVERTNSEESKILPSLEHSTWKPCFLPNSVTTVSQMLSLPSVRFTTWCSKPEDLVKTNKDFAEGTAGDMEM
jgi:hypothetical protein